MPTGPRSIPAAFIVRLLAAVVTLGLSACPDNPPPSGPDAGPDAGVNQCSVDPDCPGGLTCDLSSGTGVCRLPREFEACEIDAGCANPTAVCADIPLLGQACAMACQTTVDCADPITSCRPLPGSPTSLCLPTPCSDGGLFAPCPVEQSADGFCIPGGLFTAVCLAGGTAPLDGGCSLARTSADAADRCVPGDACTVSDGGGVCFSLCGGARDAGQGCAGGTACVSFTGDAVAGFASYGYCAKTCNPASSASCPAGLSCIDYVNPPVCWP